MSGAKIDVRDGRHYKNECAMQGEEFLKTKFSDEENFKKKVEASITLLMKNLEGRINEETKSNDHTVYTGYSGIAMLYLQLHTTIGKGRDDVYLNKAYDWLKPCLRHLRGRDVTFMCGDAGPLALGAVVLHRMGEQRQSKEFLDKLLTMSSRVVHVDSGLPDEILYGRAGYLYALHFVQQYMGAQYVPDNLLEQVRETMVASGRSLAREEQSTCPLMYQWYEEKYLGAAHGLAGIFYLLMKTGHVEIRDELRACVDYMLTLQFPSGNCPSSLGSNTDKLVHWCHGAPGWIYMFVRAYEIYQDKRYLEAAEKCAECVWIRGFLQKGYGLCHGTAGSGYSQLIIYRVTGDQKYLHRAMEFADWCCDYGAHGCRAPDRPYSMFEGMAGTIYYLADMLEPQKARFPAFEVD